VSAALNPEELNALMSAIQESRVPTGPAGAPAKAAVAPYDLTSQDRIIRGQMPTLDAINERVASLLASGLSGRTRLAIRVNTSPATLLKFADFNVLLAPPATLCILALGAGHGMAVAVLEPGLGDALLAAALGDRKARKDEVPTEARRELTTVERLVLRRLLSILTEGMAVAWSEVLPFKPEVVRFESDPRLATIAPPNDVAVLSSFELSGAITGRLQLAMPYAAVEMAKKLLASPPRMSYGGDARFSAQLADEIAQVKVEVSAVLGRTVLSLERLLALEVGDVVPLDTAEGEVLPVYVEGRHKLSGVPRAGNGNMTLVVEHDVQGRSRTEPKGGPGDAKSNQKAAEKK
jgi:flagellar motor switch protein FliM